MSTNLRFTIHDLRFFPDDDGKRYEIIDGDLHVSTQPHWRHQSTVERYSRALGNWSEDTRLGRVLPAPGIIFAEDQAVAPDLVWISQIRFSRVVGDDGKLHQAPDLVIEILSPGAKNEERDLELKLKLYSRQGVREYWIADWRDVTTRVYRHDQGVLRLVATLTADDVLTSPLLPGFAQRVGELCAEPF